MVVDQVRANGAHSESAVMDLGSTAFETFLTRVDNVVMTAYITTNRRYPKTVAGGLDAAEREWRAAREPDYGEDEPPLSMVQAVRELLVNMEDREQPPPPDLQERLDALRKAVAWYDTPRYKPSLAQWEHYLNRACMLLMPGLSYDQADGMDPVKRMNFLFRTGYVSLGGAENQDPPAPAPRSTGRKRRRGSPASTT